MNPPRLAFLTRRFWPMIGSAEKTIARLAVGLAEQGCQATVLTACWHRGWPRRIHYRGVPVIRVPYAPQTRWGTFRYKRALSAWLLDNRDCYDLVYVSGLKHEAAAAVSALGGKVPIVLRASSGGRTGDCLWQIDARGGRRIKRRCMKADALLGPTRTIERELQAAGYPRPRIHYLPDGAAVAQSRSQQTQAAARSALAETNVAFEVPRGAPLAVYTGRLNPGKGLKYLVAAWKPIVLRWPNARLWLAGEGPDRAMLGRYVEDMNLHGRVVMAGVFDDTGDLLAAADLFLQPSLSVSTSGALLEAMAAGSPIVAADLPVNRELVEDDRHGLLVPSADPNALSVAIGRLLDNPELAQRLGTAARRRVETEFSLAKMIDNHLTLMQQLLRPD